MKNLTVQEWLKIEKIERNGIIKLKNNTIIKILKIKPINYNLKSNLEKEAILNSYKIFLKTCNFNIQILIQSCKEDLSEHIEEVRKNISKKSKTNLKDISENYINYIQKINLNRKSSSKNFYIIISEKKENNLSKFETEELLKNNLNEKYFKIKECLLRTGNSVIEISNKQEIENLFYSLLNTRKKLIINK